MPKGDCVPEPPAADQWHTEEVTPIAALERVVHCLDRAQIGGFKTKAFLRALDVARGVGNDELVARARLGTLTTVDGIGASTARVIAEAISGDSSYLNELEASTAVVVSEAARPYVEALRGDCHLHSRWSDGGATTEAMARTALSLGHDYIVMTDHSPRLTVAHGLSAERLAQQVEELAALNEAMAPFRILTGIEVDILEDGSLDHDDAILAGLDVVVASVHSKLRMDRDVMTQRMLRAVSSPHVDILGHCTGRMIGKRQPSEFDAEAVFAACAEHGTAVEINCRPERLDPPLELLHVAVAAGCSFTIDSDAHATGQLEWLSLGAEIAAAAEIPIERIVNARPIDGLLAWVG